MRVLGDNHVHVQCIEREGRNESGKSCRMRHKKRSFAVPVMGSTRDKGQWGQRAQLSPSRVCVK